MRNERDEWLAQIRQNPSDWQTIMVFADWLELDEGDLLAAEQWRFLAAMAACGYTHRAVSWPSFAGADIPAPLFPYEREVCQRNNIRCMPTYPTALAEVEAYLQTGRFTPPPRHLDQPRGTGRGSKSENEREPHRFIPVKY